MSGVYLIFIIAALEMSSAAFLERCVTEADCGEDKCCLAGKICSPKLPAYSTCFLKEQHGCGCQSGSSCQVTYNYTIPIINKTFYFRQCVPDEETLDDESDNFRRFLIRKCSSETLAEDCGKERCCLGGKYCSPLLPKRMICNLQNSHKCPCGEGLKCTITKTLTIPFTDIAISLKQCMPKDAIIDAEEVEMTEN